MNERCTVAWSPFLHGVRFNFVDEDEKVQFQDTRLKKINPNQVGTFAYPVAFADGIAIMASVSLGCGLLAKATHWQCSANFVNSLWPLSILSRFFFAAKSELVNRTSVQHDKGTDGITRDPGSLTPYSRTKVNYLLIEISPLFCLDRPHHF